MAMLVNESRDKRSASQVVVDWLWGIADTSINNELAIYLDPTQLEQALVSYYSTACKDRHKFLPTSKYRCLSTAYCSEVHPRLPHDRVSAMTHGSCDPPGLVPGY